MSKQNSVVREKISFYIDKYIKENNISRTKFGAILGVSSTSVNRWVNMECAPEIEMIPEIARIINVPILDLLGFESKNSLTPNEIDVLKLYSLSESFKNLVDKYRSDEEFRVSIDYFVSMKK